MKLRQGINGGGLAIAGTIAFVLGMLWTVPAFAADKGGRTGKIAAEEQMPDWVPKYSGIVVGLNAGGQAALGNLSLDHPAGTLAEIDSLAAQGAIYGVQGAIRWQFKGTPIVAMALASYQWGDADFDVNVMGPGNVLHASVTPTWKAGGGLGYVFKNGQMLYAGYQVARGEFSVSSSLTTATLSRDLKGHNFLVGLEVPVTDFVSIAMQYDYTRYDTETLASFGPQKLDLDIDAHALTGRLNIKLPAFN